MQSLSEWPQAGEREACDDSTGKEGSCGTDRIPERAGDHAGEQEREANNQIEHPKTGAAQLVWSDIRNERREQPLREAHVQSPEQRPSGDASDARGQTEQDVGTEQEQEADDQDRDRSDRAPAG